MSGSGYAGLIKELQGLLTSGALISNKDGNLLDGKEPLQYPNDLFAHGKQAFIFFNIRRPDDAFASKGAICLYMPSTIQVSYGANWETSMLPIQKLITTASTYGNSILKLVEKSQSSGAGVGDIVKSVWDATVSDPGAQYIAHNYLKKLGGSYAAEYRNYLGKTVNPFAALIYEAPSFRTFQFEFEFFPRNATEAETARKIIKVFKLAMHPDRLEGDGGLFWSFPYVFDVFLCTPYTDKMFVVKRAALHKADVDYAGSTVQAFFKDGNPVHTKLKLEFKELELLTRSEIEENY